jgi:cyclopropane fatty-acyl-phospholipid synthase-like methyltransferase
MTSPDDPLGTPPSEQLGRFSAMYDSGPPPWDIGRPQPAFVELAERGMWSGRVLDAGCGTGEHALLAAQLGLDATGIDGVSGAIRQARRKAADRDLSARFLVWDALRLAELGEQFDTVVDSGLFHVFDDDDRAGYVAALAAVIPRDGRYCLLCFSDREPGTQGPRRVSQEEIRATFAPPEWRIEAIDPVTIDTNMDDIGIRAWRASITRTLAQEAPKR